MSANKAVLITGANRGIGLGFVKHYLNLDNYSIIACCRDPSIATELVNLSKNNNNNNSSIEIQKLDITSKSDRSDLVENLKNRSLDIVFLNAGMYGESEEVFGELSEKNLLDVIFTNSISQIMLAQDLWPFLAQGNEKLMVVLSSKMGSIGDNTKGGSYSYRASKAALNALMRSLSLDLYDKGLRLKLIHPGWVQTRMGGGNALITIDDSVNGILSIINNNNSLLSSGEFLDYSGTVVPW